MLFSIFPFQTHIHVCVETQYANFLFQKYLKEASASEELSGLLGKAKDEKMCWEDFTFSDKSISVSLPGSINHAWCESRRTEGFILKIKLVLRFRLENIRVKGYLRPQKSSSQNPLELEIVSTGQKQIHRDHQTPGFPSAMVTNSMKWINWVVSSLFLMKDNRWAKELS